MDAKHQPPGHLLVVVQNIIMKITFSIDIL